MRSHCKITNVRPKDPNIHVLNASAKTTSNLVAAANDIATYFNGDVVGYVVIGWAKDGSYSVGYQSHDDSPISNTLMPSWVHDLLLRQVTENGTIERLEE